MPNDKYFSGNPIQLDRSRSGFNRKPRWTGTWNAGYLVPIFATSSVMSGDNLKESIASAIRMTTPVFPTMDDLDVTFEAFFVPHRLILSRKSMSPDLNDSNHSWEAFLGAQDSLLNMPTPGDVKLPKMNVDNGSNYVIGGLSDCLGMPAPGSSYYYVNCLKYLAYYSVWNEYFRDPNTMQPVTYSIDSSGNVSVFGTDAGIPSGGTSKASLLPLAPVCAYHGYFGSALPWPQRNTTEVVMPLGQDAPVITGPDHDVPYGSATNALRFATAVGGSPFTGTGSLGTNSGIFGSDQSGSFSLNIGLQPSNLYADLSEATAATVNQFRLAVQTQRWYEHLARCGNKYADLINGMFGVQQYLPMDRPEYLGGFTAPILMSQVAATNNYTSATPGDSVKLGQTGAYSLSNPSGFLFSKGFTEHGTLLIVMCVRCRDSFCQGIQREDTRFDRFDFFWNEFANLGEQPILEKELYVTGSTTFDDVVFGYQEAWAEYRMFPDQVTGYAKPTVSGGIGYITYSNNFASGPTLKGFLNGTRMKALVDRTLQVPSGTAGFQFYGQFEFDSDWVRPMPLYSIPGLVDHH